MDRHVAEDAARAGDVVQGRGAGIAGGDGDHLDIAQAALGNLGLDGGEMRVKAAVEADHQHGLGVAHDLEAGLDTGQRQIDRLFAEDRLAGLGEFLDQVGMGVGRRADHDGVDVLGGQNRLDRANLAAVLISNRLSGGRHGVGHGDQLGTGMAGDGLGVDLADAASPQKPET